MKGPFLAKFARKGPFIASVTAATGPVIAP